MILLSRHKIFNIKHLIKTTFDEIGKVVLISKKKKKKPFNKQNVFIIILQ